MRKLLLLVIVLITGVVFAGRLFYLQIYDTSFQALSENNAVKVIYDYPQRGYIFDRNGELLVANQPSYDVMVIPREVKPLDTLEFCKLLKLSKDEFKRVLEKARIYSPRLPSVVIPQLTKGEYAYLSEKMYKYEGFYIQKRSLRDYKIEHSANVLGYIREVDDRIIKKNPYYQMGELIGAQGVENQYEEVLRGVKGVKRLQKDRFNRIIGPFKEGIFDTLPERGKDITLTIDAELQKYGEELFVNKRGGIVAIEPATGEILSLVTAPYYDPGLLVGRERSANYTRLYYDSIAKPLFDRGLQGEYPPGSPFKTLTALIGLQENVIDSEERIACHGGYRDLGRFGQAHLAWMTPRTNNGPVSIDLGIPAPPPPVVSPRRKSRQLILKHHSKPLAVGGDAPVSVQSMCTTLTADVNATLQQIAELTATGCQAVRVAVPSQDDADALSQIAKKSGIPVIADIHFQPKYVFAAIDAGCAAVRVNPGNIKKFDDKVGEIARAAKDAGTPIRIGVNAGSLDPRLMEKYGKATPEALVESALWEASLFEEHGFQDIKISVKHHDPVIMMLAYMQLAEQCDYPLHLGVTEAGPAFQGTIKSAVAFGGLLSRGIGDTIRVSLSAPPVEEVKVGIGILESLNLRQRGLEIVSCPSCGRAQVDVYTLAEQVTAGLEGLDVPLRVAVMGCVVNGPGEAREADLGVASGNGKGQIFVRGEVIKTVPEAQIVETLIEEAMKLAENMTDEGSPTVVTA